MSLKYNFDLDMESDNSCSLILREIKSNSQVLELGPAHGRMTKYLKQTLNCFVCIVEKDSEAGDSAKQFSDKFYIGGSSGDGDIDGDIWHYNLKITDHKFDYIVMADVLEHLNNPWLALERAVELLKDDGKILISVPNISHNSVIIDLMNDKFNYRETGLLDNTHIRFFTNSTLKKMVENANLMITKEMNTHCAVEHTEFRNNLNDVPGNVGRFLNKRLFGDVYQFVWELQKVKN